MSSLENDLENKLPSRMCRFNLISGCVFYYLCHRDFVMCFNIVIVHSNWIILDFSQREVRLGILFYIGTCTMACNLVVEKYKFKINKRQVYVANTHKKNIM